MTNQPHIEWTGHTWNTSTGCSKISPGLQKMLRRKPDTEATADDGTRLPEWFKFIPNTRAMQPNRQPVLF